MRPNSLCSVDCLSMPDNLQTESPNAMWASLFLFLSLLVCLLSLPLFFPPSLSFLLLFMCSLCVCVVLPHWSHHLRLWGEDILFAPTWEAFQAAAMLNVICSVRLMMFVVVLFNIVINTYGFDVTCLSFAQQRSKILKYSRFRVVLSSMLLSL